MTPAQPNMKEVPRGGACSCGDCTPESRRAEEV